MLKGMNNQFLAPLPLVVDARMRSKAALALSVMYTGAIVNEDPWRMVSYADREESETWASIRLRPANTGTTVVDAEAAADTWSDEKTSPVITKDDAEKECLLRQYIWCIAAESDKNA